MGKLTVVLFFVLSSYLSHAQESFLDEDIKVLVLLTIDLESKNNYKEILLDTSLVKNKEAFLKDYEAAITSFIQNCGKYYKAEYTHEEIREMIKFYKTPIGKKLAKDNSKLLSNNFPVNKEWDSQLYELRKKGKN